MLPCSPSSDGASLACLPADENIPEELFLLDELGEVYAYGEQLQVRVGRGGGVQCIQQAVAMHPAYLFHFGLHACKSP